MRFSCRLTGLGIFVMGACLGFSAVVKGKTDLPAGGESILGADPLTSHGFWAGNNEGPVGSRQIIVADHPDFDQAIRVTITNPNGVFYNGQVSFSSAQTVQAGDVLMLRLFFRAISSQDETGTSFTTVYPQSPGPAFTKYLNRDLSAFPADGWVEFLLPFQVTDTLPPGDLSLLFGLGGGRHPQVWEIGGVELLNYRDLKTVEELPQTLPSYLGREADAPWRVDAAARIEQHRKGPMRIHVLDANGNPVPQAAIQVEMLKHAYHFGSAISVSRLTGQGVDSDRYREKVTELFNQAGPENGFKWGAWDGEWGSTNFGREIALEATSWLKEQGLFTRGHVMVWPSRRNLPNSIQSYLPEENPANADPAAKQAVLDHIADVGSASEPIIDEWDVLNEPYDNYYLMEAFGDAIMIDWFQQARAVLPTQGLYLNDYSILSGGGRNAEHQQHFEDTTEFLIEGDAPITGLGMQGHFNSSPTSIPILWEVLERYTTAFPDLDIRITEFSVSTADEAMQADYLRDFFTLVFSHPQTVGIQLWGFWEEQIFDNSTALFRSDWSPKPNALAYQDLVLGEWWNNFNGSTTDRGVFDQRGFFGDYKAIVSLDGIETEMEFTLQKGGAHEFTMLLNNPMTGEVPINNGNFETGDVEGWTITAADEFEYAPNVEFGGTNSPYFPIEPTAGNAVLTLGLKGPEIGTIQVEQRIQIPDVENITLSFDYRGAAQLLNTFNGTPFDLHVERENGEAVMTPIAIYHPSTSAPNPDTGIQRRRVKLEQFRGETLRIRFSLTNNGSGENNYTFVMLDNIVLAPFSPPTAQVELNDQHQVQLKLSASDDAVYQLESSLDLESWEIESRLENLDLEFQQPYLDEDFSGGSKFYRLREMQE